MRRLIVTLLGLMLTGPAIAQSPPGPDGRGDYYQNVGRQLGTAPPALQAGYLWQVVASGLNCRSQATTRSQVVRQFRRGDILQADVGRGGSDEVLFNALDAARKPWMRVRSARGQSYDCYVRANRQYIVPYIAR